MKKEEELRIKLREVSLLKTKYFLESVVRGFQTNLPISSQKTAIIREYLMMISLKGA